MARLKNNIWFAAVAVMAVCVTVFSLSYFVTKPSHIFPELGGDAAKNSFTYLYHSTLGKGYWFEGMNYPYGEHIVYTDGQPVLSVLLAHFHSVTVGQALTCLWLLIGLSYVLAILYIYGILRQFRVAYPAAIIFSCIIGIFTPQILRLQGHYALSYTCIIPMIFYWTIRYHERPALRYCLYFFVLGCITAFLHPYYAAVMFVWALAYAAGFFVFSRGQIPGAVKHVAPLLASVLLVMVFVAVVMKLTDPAKDRPVSPFNVFYETCTRPKQIVTSVNSPIWKSLQGTRWFRYVSEGGEGYVYVGLVVMLTLCICGCIMFIKLIRKRQLDILAGSSGFSPVWLFMAFTVLLFSMGVPFIWHIEWLDYLSVFRQFRSFGRFSWIFYYIIAVYTVVLLYQFFERMKAERRLAAGYVVLLAAAGLWAYEASGYVKFARYLSKKALYNYDMIFSVHEQGWQSFLLERHHSPGDFQAVLVLPFFHVGTEKLWVGNPSWVVTLAAKASLQLSLPVVDVMMSRSSWSVAKKQVKIAAGPYVEKPILADIKSDKPFLLLHFEEDSLNPDEQYLLQASDYLGHLSQCHVYACYPRRLAANDKKNRDSVARILPFMHGLDTVIAANGTCYIEHFDANVAQSHVFGAAQVPDTDSSIVANISITPPADSQLYEFSCWFLLGDKNYRTPYVTVRMIDNGGKVDTFTDALTRQSTDNNGMWFRSSKYFWVHSNIRSLRCNLVNVPRPTCFGMDEILLRPAGALVISKMPDGSVMVNNHMMLIK